MDSGDSNELPGSSVADYVVGDDEMPDGASKTSTAPTALKAPQGGGDGLLIMHEDSKEESTSNKAEARVNEAREIDGSGIYMTLYNTFRD